MAQSADLLASLPHLSAVELEQVRDRVAVLLTLGPSPARRIERRGQALDADDFARDFYEAVARELQRRTQVKSAPYLQATKSKAFVERFVPAAHSAFQANAQWFPKQTRIERGSMLGLYANLVLDDLARRGQPALWHSIAFAVSNLPQVVDQAFPGYAAAGLLGKVQSLRCRGGSPV